MEGSESWIPTLRSWVVTLLPKLVSHLEMGASLHTLPEVIEARSVVSIMSQAGWVLAP